jgi:hypothetical protein
VLWVLIFTPVLIGWLCFFLFFGSADGGNLFVKAHGLLTLFKHAWLWFNKSLVVNLGWLGISLLRVGNHAPIMCLQYGEFFCWKGHFAWHDGCILLS